MTRSGRLLLRAADFLLECFPVVAGFSSVGKTDNVDRADPQTKMSQASVSLWHMNFGKQDKPQTAP